MVYRHSLALTVVLAAAVAHESCDVEPTLKDRVICQRKIKIAEERARDEWRRDFAAEVAAHCGDICSTEGGERGPGDDRLFKRMKKSVECDALWRAPDLKSEQPQGGRPERAIPKFMEADFTYGGRVEAKKSFKEEPEVDGNGGVIKWSRADIEERARSGNFNGGYGPIETQRMWQFLSEEKVAGARVLVIGSQTPWIEAILVRLNASRVVSMEYSAIECDHPKVDAVTPEALARAYSSGTLRPFDLVVSFSSIEHSGLGRYGDAINPWGDLMTMARAWCVTRQGGKAVIGVPAARDLLLFNEARVYGRLQLAHLFANWDLVATDVEEPALEKECVFCTAYQPIFVLEKIRQ